VRLLRGGQPAYWDRLLEKSAENEQTSTDFERKVGLLFKMLGFQVQQLGSGKGAVPDVIARGYCPDHQYALLIDSKARQNKNYQISTPDQRALTDYARHFFKEYENRGLHAHLLIVSSGFANDQTEKIREIRSNSRIRSVCLITAQDLLFLLESRLKNCKIDVEKLYDLFSTDGIISRERITETLPAE